MKLRFIVQLAICVCFSMVAEAQNGIVRGNVIDEIGEPLFSANAVLKGTGIGLTSDFDGKFELSAEPGIYELEISFIGYATIVITDVEVKPGEVTLIENIKIEPSSSQLAAVTVTATQIKNNETSVLLAKKKSGNVTDGISAQTFRKMGDGDAAAAVTRVPGVSLQDGKYVFVRGLGDRYTKTQLNGLDVPGLDPDRNSLQLDIFPTNVIDNILVVKSFSAELPADFVGGLVNIETKEFPEKKTFSVSANVGYNPNMHFNSNYLTQDRSSLDFLGFDAGSNNRKLPYTLDENNQNPIAHPASSNSNSAEVVSNFSGNLAAIEGTSPMDFGLNLSGGNQIKKEKRTIGFSGSLSYKNNTKFYEDREQNYWLKDRKDPNVYDLKADRLTIGDRGVNDIFLSAMGGLAIKTNTSKIKINVLHLQNAQTTSAYILDQQFINNSATIYRDNLEYSERSISNVLIAGKHSFEENPWGLEWKLAPTYSRIADKDIRVTPYLFDPSTGDYSIDASEAAVPQRLWRSLGEIIIPLKVDVTREQKLLGKEAKLKVGAAYSYKFRSFSTANFNMEDVDGGTLKYTGNADELVTSDFVYNRTRGTGMYYIGNYLASNGFESSQSNMAVYVSEELRFGNRWRSIVGLRGESYIQKYTGQNQKGDLIFDAEEVMNNLDLFPSVSLIFAANEKTNLRFAYFKTIARPSFKEKSTAEIADPLSSSTFIGNIDLEATDIQNFDVRYEVFLERNQTFSVSGFYKSFTNPIELVSFDADPGSLQPRNVGDATLLGLEIESRIGLKNVAKFLENVSFNTNLTFIESKVAFDKSTGGEFQGKQNGLRTGEKLDNERDMQGQAPYIINTGLSYTGRENGLQVGVFYNVQGPKLTIVGINFNPDVYSVPFHGLNFNMSKKFGKDDKYSFGFGVDNILGSKREFETKSYKADAQIYSMYDPGRLFSLSLSYKFN